MGSLTTSATRLAGSAGVGAARVPGAALLVALGWGAKPSSRCPLLPSCQCIRVMCVCSSTSGSESVSEGCHALAVAYAWHLWLCTLLWLSKAEQGGG